MNRKKEILDFLGIHIHVDPVEYEIISTEHFDDYERHLIEYEGSKGDVIPAFLFRPKNQPIVGSILVHHQHNSERHLGKSEVAGIVGDRFQAFGPVLARQAFAVLAPDSICFEDRRLNAVGIEPCTEPYDDTLQHYNAMCYALLQGDLLMKQVIEDSSIAINILAHMDDVPIGKIGILGHSYGGNTVIFHSPFDDRIKFSCTSGAACSFANKMQHHTGIELAEVIPGFSKKYDIDDLLKLISPRKLLILSAEQDQFAMDADVLFDQVQRIYAEAGVKDNIAHMRFVGVHALDQERFEIIVRWFVEQLK